MPNELKIVIDADVQKAVTGVQNLSKVIAGDFTKATNAAVSAASNLSSQVATSVQKINSSLAALKITSLDVKVNTSSIDASIKSIQSKFASLVDPELNVFANTAQAELKIKELLAELSTLKGSEIFIRANDTQALQKINQIEAELNDLVGKNININVAADLSKINDLKAKLDTLKVTPISITADSSTIDASIKSIQSKFAALVDPKINILANTQEAEVKIKELLSELSALKSSQVFIGGNNSDALKKINEIETELNSLVGKQIKLDVNTADAAQRIRALEQQLFSLEQLKISPDVSTTQLALFESNIQKIKAELDSLKTKAPVIPIGVDTAGARAKLNTLSETIETIRARIESKKAFIQVETDITKIAAYNKEIEGLEQSMRSIQNVGKRGFELFVVPNQTIRSVKNLNESVAAFGGGVKTFVPPAIAGFNKLPSSISPIITQLKALEKQSVATGAATTSAFSKAFGGLKSLAALIPGIGLGGLIGLAATAVNNLTQGFFDAAFGASKLDKALDAASGSIDANAASVITMVRALQSGTLSSSDFKKVKAELIAQAPEFQKSFEGDKISIAASEAALKTYVNQLTTTVKVTAALSIVNETLAKSIAVIAKGGEVSFGNQLLGFLKNLGNFGGALTDIGNEAVESIEKAKDALKGENISKLIEDTFKSLGITFKDFAGTIDDKALKAALEKQKAAFEKFVSETIAKAKQFSKEFGQSFVVPDLEESFFKTRQQVFKESLKLLSDVKSFLSGNQEALKIKLPVLVTTETKVNTDDLKKFLRNELSEDKIGTFKIRVPVITDLDIQIAESVLEGSLKKEAKIAQDRIEDFFKSVQSEVRVPVSINPDVTLSKANIDAINKKLNLKDQFRILGDLGLKEFEKIDFSNINKGIEEATKRLEGMMAIATTLNQAIGQGLTNAFNSVFDAVLEGKNVFKVLANAIKELIISTIKAIAQMLILRFVTNLIFPGAAAAGGLRGVGQLTSIGLGGAANFGAASGIGSRAFNNVLTVNVVGQISNDVIRIAGQRAAGSADRFG